MTEEELENWQAVDYRMRNEGIDYCFEHYSQFEEIKDELEKQREELYCEYSGLPSVRAYDTDQV